MMKTFTIQDMLDQAKADQKAHHKAWGKGPSEKTVSAVKAAAKQRGGPLTAALRVRIADLIHQGLNDQQIARRLNRSKDTIYYHSKPIRERMNDQSE